jgi:hypothetical protein
MYLLLFWICFRLFDPFHRKLVAIDLVAIRCCFVICSLVAGFGWYFFPKIGCKTC